MQALQEQMSSHFDFQITNSNQNLHFNFERTWRGHSLNSYLLNKSQVSKVIGILNEFLKELLFKLDMMSPKIAFYLLVQVYFNGSFHPEFTEKHSHFSCLHLENISNSLSLCVQSHFKQILLLEMTSSNMNTKVLFYST